MFTTIHRDILNNFFSISGAPKSAFVYHGNDGLDGVSRGLLAAGLLDQAGAEVLDIEGDALDHWLAERSPILAELWKKRRERKGRLKTYLLYVQYVFISKWEQIS